MRSDAVAGALGVGVQGVPCPLTCMGTSLRYCQWVVDADKVGSLGTVCEEEMTALALWWYQS